MLVLVSGDQMKEDEMGRTCGKHEGAAKCQGQSGVKKKKVLEDHGVDLRKVL